MANPIQRLPVVQWEPPVQRPMTVLKAEPTRDSGLPAYLIATVAFVMISSLGLAVSMYNFTQTNSSQSSYVRY